MNLRSADAKGLVALSLFLHNAAAQVTQFIPECDLASPCVNTSDSTAAAWLVGGHIWEWESSSMPFKGAFRRNRVLVQDGLIKAVEADDGHGVGPEDGARVVDLQGAYAVPGLHDSHIHVEMTGAKRSSVDLANTTSIDDIGQRCKQFAESHPNRAWIVGSGWAQESLKERRMPTRKDIDKYVPDRPVFLYRACFHVAVTNTAGLRAANLPLDQVDSWGKVDGGRVGLYDDGTPDGLFYEEPAYSLVTSYALAESDEVRMEFISSALEEMARTGLTAVQSNDGDAVELYRRLEAAKRLPIRVFHTVMFEDLIQAFAKHMGSEGPSTEEVLQYARTMNDSDRQELLRTQLNVRGPSVHSRVSCDRVKVFADGSLGAKTAAVRQPYKTGTTTNETTGSPAGHSDVETPWQAHAANGTDQGGRGILIETPDELQRRFELATLCGLRLEVHAIGDRAAEEVLDAFDRAGVPPSMRPVLTHCQLLGRDLIDKMKRLGVIGNIQPPFVPTDASWVDKVVGGEALEYAYVWKTIMDGGIPCSGGSDSPIEHFSPLKGILDAIYRPTQHVYPLSSRVTTQPQGQLPPVPSENDTFRPEERLTFDEALALYTIGGAFASRTDDQTAPPPSVLLGHIKPGYAADLTVLDCDISSHSWRSILEARVRGVWVGGQQYVLTDTPTTD
ncbi:unnamed protein product [Vitrella brassicaformis CCMP3155]|uniref:Amidohydrolase 3 domain-containing protein n=2 Tax=Vitrella brassicaformis TaxID=1169539 RepID=A0A0G4G6L9_VITBC|nr:unnamed protein product [Vitrella brassicaformis CCMP3155]|eukprot:CEM24002.1 unnamed protein product [Vitrella brassicaformis CCMP3155]